MRSMVGGVRSGDAPSATNHFHERRRQKGEAGVANEAMKAPLRTTGHSFGLQRPYPLSG